MIHPRKPVWTEGLFMTPQHLQQSDQYHEALLHSRMHAVMSYDWGITGVAFDERALVAGQLKLLKCHGFFPDGTPFFVGDRGEDSVEARPLEGAFPAAIETLDIFLAVPNQRDNHSNVGLDPAKAGPAVRYVAQSTTVADLNTGRNETAVIWAKGTCASSSGPRRATPSTRSASASSSATAPAPSSSRRASSLPSSTSAPPSTSWRGSAACFSALVGKQKSLAEGWRMRTASSVDFQASDTAKFWLLHTCNSYIPLVSHIVDHGDAHPEDVFILLGQIIGELCTFDADGDPTTIPKFNYLELTDVFDPMFERAIRMITGVIAENYVVVPLEKREDGMYLGKFEDPKLPRTHELFLEAKGTDEGTLRERLPRLLKIGSWTQIGYILNAAMPGVRVGIEYRPRARSL